MWKPVVCTKDCPDTCGLLATVKDGGGDAMTLINTIKDSACFTPEIAVVALEHHEKLDGSGYPKGNTEISEDAQLIGLISSYKPLAYRGTSRHEEPQKPYNSLQILKNEVMAGKYSRQMFISFCSCLTR